MRSLILFINLINVIINIQMLILVNIDVKMLQVNVIVNVVNIIYFNDLYKVNVNVNFNFNKFNYILTIISRLTCDYVIFYNLLLPNCYEG